MTWWFPLGKKISWHSPEVFLPTPPPFPPTPSLAMTFCISTMPLLAHWQCVQSIYGMQTIHGIVAIRRLRAVSANFMKMRVYCLSILYSHKSLFNESQDFKLWLKFPSQKNSMEDLSAGFQPSRLPGTTVWGPGSISVDFLFLQGYGWCVKPMRDSLWSWSRSHSIYFKALGSTLKFWIVNLCSSFLCIIIF